MNIALFGGSFDPPHLGHDSIVKKTLSELDIDKLIVMPTYISPFKSEFSAPPSLRLSWIERIWGDLDNVEISKFEIEQNRPVPTIQTVEYLYKIYSLNTLFLIIGADHIATLEKWHEYDKLINLVKFVVISRDDICLPSDFVELNLNVNISSSELRSCKKIEFLDKKIQSEVVKFYKGKKC